MNQGASENATTRQRNLIVDHITPHRGDSELFWLDTNHQTLCRYPCHDSDKSRHEHRGMNAAQWYDMLAKTIIEGSTWQHVESCTEWVPTHVMSELRTRMTDAIASLPGRGGSRLTLD